LYSLSLFPPSSLFPLPSLQHNDPNRGLIILGQGKPFDVDNDTLFITLGHNNNIQKIKPVKQSTGKYKVCCR
jgi:hypothetical protein